MAILSKGTTFANGDQVTAAKLNALVDSAAFVSGSGGSTDNSSLEVSSGVLAVKDSGITANKIATNAVTTVKILDANVTTAKIADLNVTSGKIADLGVTTAKIADLNVTTGKIADAAVTAAKLAEPLTLGTAQNSTSGTTVSFNDIPSWVKRVTVMFSGVSISSTNPVEVILGTGTSGSPTYVTSGYSGAGFRTSTFDLGGTILSTGFIIDINNATTLVSGQMIISKFSGNTWVASAVFGGTSGDIAFVSGGSVSLGATLTQLRIKTTSTDTFDAGQINIMYE